MTTIEGTITSIRGALVSACFWCGAAFYRWLDGYRCCLYCYRKRGG